MCVCVCAYERESVSVWRVYERESVCVWVRESVCACVCVGVVDFPFFSAACWLECGCVCVCECVGMSVSVSVCEHVCACVCVVHVLLWQQHAAFSVRVCVYIWVSVSVCECVFECLCCQCLSSSTACCLEEKYQIKEAGRGVLHRARLACAGHICKYIGLILCVKRRVKRNLESRLLSLLSAGKFDCVCVCMCDCLTHCNTVCMCRERESLIWSKNVFVCVRVVYGCLALSDCIYLCICVRMDVYMYSPRSVERGCIVTTQREI